MRLTKVEFIFFVVYGIIFLILTLFVIPLIAKDNLRTDKQEIYKMLDSVTISTFLQNFTGQQVREIKVFEKDSYFTATFELYPIIRKGSILFYRRPSVIVKIYREEFKTRDALDNTLLSYPFYCMFETSEDNPSETFFNCLPGGSATKEFSPTFKKAYDTILRFYENRKHLDPIQNIPGLIPLALGTLLAIFAVMFYFINLLRFRGILDYFSHVIVYAVGVVGGSYLWIFIVNKLLSNGYYIKYQGIAGLAIPFIFVFCLVFYFILVTATAFLLKLTVGSLSSKDLDINRTICFIIAVYLFFFSIHFL